MCKQQKVEIVIIMMASYKWVWISQTGLCVLPGQSTCRNMWCAWFKGQREHCFQAKVLVVTCLGSHWCAPLERIGLVMHWISSVSGCSANPAEWMVDVLMSLAWVQLSPAQNSSLKPSCCVKIPWKNTPYPDLCQVSWFPNRTPGRRLNNYNQ